MWTEALTSPAFWMSFQWAKGLVANLEGYAYHPTETLLALLPAPHVYEAATGLTADFVCGQKFRVVDVSGYEVPDDRWHSVCITSAIKTVSDWEMKEANVHWILRKTAFFII